ncbi:MAG: glutaredoxin domain-containing protein [Candidatus Peregrinibacteria bacterium]|nr:glutaredoxin domain-containing protein [Candidatus Peregrinibacteria bacterium]
MADVVLYTKSYCPFSKETKEMLEGKGVEYTEFLIDDDSVLAQEMEIKSGRTDTPQVFINGTHIGSGDDLKALDSQGELDKLLNV